MGTFKPCAAYSTGHMWTMLRIYKGGGGLRPPPPLYVSSKWSTYALYCRLHMAYVQLMYSLNVPIYGLYI